MNAQFRLKVELFGKKINNETMEEKMIETKFTRDQFESLLKLVSTATWVINAFKEQIIEEFEELEQYLLSLAQKEGFSNLIEFDEDTRSLLPSEKLEDEIQKYIEDYNDEIFWQTLMTRLAIRDLEREYGKSAVEKMEINERIKKINPIFNSYAEEFAENGLENLVLAKKEQ